MLDDPEDVAAARAVAESAQSAVSAMSNSMLLDALPGERPISVESDGLALTLGRLLLSSNDTVRTRGGGGGGRARGW